MQFLRHGFVTGCFLILSLGQTHAHAIPSELMDFILENPQASFSELNNYAQSIKETAPEDYQDWQNYPIGVALQLPGKKDLIDFMYSNPNFAKPEIENLVNADPVFAEIGTDAIYEYFLKEIKPYVGTETVPPAPEIIEEISFPKFIYLGVIHILGGWDHVLFVLSLILLLPTIRHTLALLTTFTIAHSLTLLLAGSDWIKISSNIVEPIIALSIVFVALSAYYKPIRSKQNLYKNLGIIFIFGLFHGLGFAGVFSEISIASDQKIVGLLGFNLGVEVGQILIVMLLYPVLHWIYKTNQAHKTKDLLACLLIFAGFYWFLERII